MATQCTFNSSTVEHLNGGHFGDNKNITICPLLRGCPHFSGFNCVLKYLRNSDLLFIQRLLIHRPFFGVSLKRNFTALEIPALLASERSERDTIRNVQIRAGVVYVTLSLQENDGKGSPG